jgi:hypothetical protein
VISQRSLPAISADNLRRAVVTASEDGWSDASLEAASTGEAGSDALAGAVPPPKSVEISQVRNGAVNGDALRTTSQTAHVGRSSTQMREAIAMRQPLRKIGATGNSVDSGVRGGKSIAARERRTTLLSYYRSRRTFVSSLLP